MALSQNTFTKEAVPDDFVNTWNLFEHKNFEGKDIGTLQNTNDSIDRMGKSPGLIDGLTKAKFHFDGWNDPQCNRFGRNCKNSGRISSLKLPIGAWGGLDKDCNDTLSASFYWKDNDGKIPNNTAVNCSTGDMNQTTGDQSHVINFGGIKTTDRCFIGNSDLSKHSSGINDAAKCTVAGIHYPSYCQLGDYIDTNKECELQCKFSKGSDLEKNYCNFAKDRLCGVQKGDPLKQKRVFTNKTINILGRDRTIKLGSNVLVKSDRNYITEPLCTDYCGGPNELMSSICDAHKRAYCINPLSWPEAGEYCTDYWKGNFNSSEANKACGAKLVDGSSPENISTGNGCGKLCLGRGLDANDQYCNARRRDFCSVNNNLETNYCFNFCKDHPDLCENKLNEYCKDKADRLDEELPSGKTIGDYCGCFMGTKFYEDYKNNVFSQFQQNGFKIEGVANIRSEPECIFPQCKSGAILTSAQQNNLPNCGTDCVQVMLNQFDQSTVNGDFLAQQSAECINITENVTNVPDTGTTLPPGIPDFDDTTVIDNNTNNTNDDVIDEQIVGEPTDTSSPDITTTITTSETDLSPIIGGVVGFILFILICVGIYYYYSK